MVMNAEMCRESFDDSTKKNETFIEFKSYKKENASGYLDLDRGYSVEFGQMYEETHIAFELPEVGDIVQLFELHTHSRLDDEYLPMGERDFITGEYPLWEVVSFSRGRSAESITLHNNFVTLRRKLRNGASIKTTIRTIDLGLGVIRAEKVASTEM